MADEPQRLPYPKDFTAHKVTLLDPILADTQASTKKYVDDAIAVATGDLRSKDPVDAATVSALPANTRTGDVLTSVAAARFPDIDGVVAAVGKTYLVKNEGGGSSHINNGIYELTQLGDAGDVQPWKLTRRSDLANGDNASHIFLDVDAGTVNGDSSFKCINNDGSAVVNTDALEFKFWGQTTDHANLKNKAWSVAGHTIDTTFDTLGNDIEMGGGIIYHPSAIESDVSASILIRADVNIDLELGDNAGVQTLNVRDSDNAVVFSIDSDGGITAYNDLDMNDHDITDVNEISNDGDIYLRSTAGDVNIRLADAAGVRKFIVMDSTTGEVFTVTSTGLITHEPSGAYIDADGKVNLQNELDMAGNDILNVSSIGSPANIYISTQTGGAPNAIIGITTGNYIYMKLDDNAGVSKVYIRDSDDVDVASIDSDGNLTLAGLLPDHASEHLETGADPLDLNGGDFYVSTITEDYFAIITNGDGTAGLQSPIKEYSGISEPTLGLNQLAMWIDTDDSNRFWLTYRSLAGVQHKVELAAHSRYHVTDHEYGGADELLPANIGQYGVAALDASGNVASPPQLHGTSHELSGTDEISVEGLSGLLADRQTPLSHAHDGVDGSGTVAHSDLTGQTADDHHNQVHAFCGSDHSADTLANLNLKVSDLMATYGGLRDFGIGTLAQRPAAGTANRFWWATDNDLLYYDNGASWDTINAEPEAHAIGGASHTADTLANLNTKISDATLLDSGDIQFQTGSLHAAADHENGGALEISVAGLSGLLADAQNPTNHASNHTDGTDDIQDASVSQKGLVNTSAQEFAGAKTFNDGVISESDITLQNPGTSSDSHELIMIADNAGTPQYGSLKTAYGADPYVRLSVPNASGVKTAALDFNDTQVNPANPSNYDLGTSGSKFKDLHLAGDIYVDGTVDGVDIAAHDHDGTASGGVAIEGDNLISTGISSGKVLEAQGDGTVEWVDPSGGTDANAIHVNASSEISGIASKGTLVDGDYLVIEDSAASNAKKSILASVLKTYAQTGVEGTAIKSTSETEGLALISQGDDSADWQKYKMSDLNPESAPDGALVASDGAGGVDIAIRYSKSIERVTPMGMTIGANTAGYFLWGRSDTYTSTEANAQVDFPKSRLVAYRGNVTAYAGTVSFTVRINGSPTGITGTISSTGHFDFDNSGTPVSVSEGDLVSVYFSVGAGGTLTLYGSHLVLEAEVV